MSQLTPQTTVPLSDGNAIPLFGLGVWTLPDGKATERAVSHALELGYRLIDTAAIYDNERAVGTAVRDSGIDREEIFVTTKLWNSDQGRSSTRAAFEHSLELLGLDYVDLYLLHWPVEGLRHESWEVLVELKEEGLARSIGVSNYTISHLRQVFERSQVPPVLNQVEYNPFLYQHELLGFCNDQDIALQAYCPLARAKRMKDPTLRAVASEVSKTPAQVMLRWIIQRGVIAIPKSGNKGRIAENADIYDFALSDDQMQRLDSLHEELRLTWDPSDIP